MKNQKPMIILIAGGTSSGKGTLANKLTEYFLDSIALLGTDDYTSVELKEGVPWGSLSREQQDKEKKDVKVVTKIEHDWYNPKNVHWKELFEDLDIVVEGTNVLQNEELRNMSDLKCYSHTDDDKRLILKIRRSPWFKKMVGEESRDPRNFGGTDPRTQLVFAFEAWWNGSIIAEKKWVIPTQKYADLVIIYNESKELIKNTKTLIGAIDLYFNNPVEFQKQQKELREGGNKEKVVENLNHCYKNMIDKREKNRKIANSLYDLVQEQVKQKGRKVKIITDWDDCLQPVKTRAIYWYSPELQKHETFAQFHDNFWEGAIINPTSVGGDKLHEEYVGSEEEKIALAKFEEERQARKRNPELYEGNFYVSGDRFNTPLNSMARQLLTCLKEDLVSELVIISSYRKTTTDGPKVQKFLEQERDMKKNKILRTFGKFPQCKLELTEVEKDSSGRYRPFRWEIIKKNHPDFDIYVDDSTRGTLEVRTNFSNDQGKIYVFPDYKCSRHIIGDNIYHIKTTVSFLKDEDFVKAAEEYKQKQQAKNALKTSRGERERERLLTVSIRNKRRNVNRMFGIFYP